MADNIPIARVIGLPRYLEDLRREDLRLDAVKQPLDADLTAIAALTTTTFGRSLLTLANALALRNIAELGTTDTVQFGATTLASLLLSNTVWDDLRFTPADFGFVASDPKMVNFQPGGSGPIFQLPEFAIGDVAYAFAQMPHGYKGDTTLKAHIHWNPGAYGVAQRNATVGWKVSVALAGENGVFPSGTTYACTATVPADCADYQYLNTTSVSVTVPSGFANSGGVMVRLERTDTGADDTWSEVVTGRLPLLHEVDFHYELDKLGTDDEH